MPRRRLLVLALVAFAAAAPTASAGTLAASAVGCDDRVYEKPFTRWLDVFNYFHMPDGGIENGAEGWTLTGGAAPVAGNEPFYVHGAGESKSLALPSGSSATTAATCTGIDYATMRFFVRRTGGSILSTLRVDALYEGANGVTQTIPNIGVVLGVGTGWQPSLPMVVVGSVMAPLVSDQAVIAFKFTPSAGSSWRIDDVYLDPFAKH